ncbi:MAG: CocE/NonD family hydrolase [Chitinophagaceae bacterium]|nr:CocE/NonD family hydrolase [Chitinophagaceae bacterium]
MKKLLLLAVTAFTLTSAIAQNQDSIWFVNNYTKVNQYIPMRDGVRLYTSIYIPKDTSSAHPFLMTRTPYSVRPYGDNEFPAIWATYKMKLARLGYIFVFQDVRGRYMSEGVFMDVRPFNKNKKGKEIDEASDTYDTVDWLVKNVKNNNGKLAVTGTSYPGFYSTEAALSEHPALVAASPQAPVTDWFMGDDFHHKGVFFVMDGFSFYPRFGTPHPVPSTTYTSGFSFKSDDNYDAYLKTGALKNFAKLMGDSIPFWHEMYQHPNYDEWWQARDARRGLYDVKPAMLWVGGLFDAEDVYGAWNTFKATEAQSPQTNNKIVMGPWYHGQWSREGSFHGNVRFGENTSQYFQDSIEIPFFNHHLLGTPDPNLSKATIFFTGENNWHRFDAWPPKNVEEVNLYLEENGKLSLGVAPKSTSGYDQYVSDPKHPVPYAEGVHFRRTREYMSDDQRFASRRPDVLTYETDILKEDITLAGPVFADLMTSISTTDADFVVKLIDVFPDDFRYPENWLGDGKNYPMGGYQMLVRAEIMRGKFRNSFEHPEPFVPGQVAEVKWELPDVAHTFKKGHRIMIQVQSSWFPLADMNPQKFVDIYKADDSDFQEATIRIHRNATNASKIILPVLKK